MPHRQSRRSLANALLGAQASLVTGGTDNHMLVLDTVTDAVSGVDTESVHSGNNKWIGITAVGTKVYAAPFRAPRLLVLDTESVTARRLADCQSEDALPSYDDTDLESAWG
mgnify:CR=1 FL=1